MAQHFGGGMGSHKHGVSGHSNLKTAIIQTAALLNREAAKAAEARENGKEPMCASIADLMKRTKRAGRKAGKKARRRHGR